jgi:glycerol kinase
MPFVLALDQGTTSSRAILFAHDGSIRGLAQKEFTQIYPQAGHVEHDPMEIWQSQLAVAHEVLHKTNTPAAEVAAIGITNQRETTILWDKKTGQPVHNAIVWQDRRTASICDQLRRDGHEKTIQQKTGLVPDAYFSASKIQWLLDNVHGLRTRATAGELAFGTVDSWLLYNLTGGATGGGGHATDVSNASRTMLYNIHSHHWDPDLLQLFNIPQNILPEVKPSSGQFGETTPNLFAGKKIPITGIAGDQQAALFGQACFSRGLAKNTYGTGCFMLMNVGESAPTSQHKLLTTIAWQLPQSTIENQKSKIQNQTEYALEGSVFIGGAVVQWLRDGLGLIKSANDIEPLAASVNDNGGLYIVPAFAGLGAPHWDQYARGTITGITRGTTAAHFARAALESIAFQVADVLDIMQKDSKLPIKELRVDGGASANNLLLQFQADLLQVPVVRPRVTETTALGAAYLAGLGTGFWKSKDEVAKNWSIDRTFEPKQSPDQTHTQRQRWTKALNRSLDWEEH